MTESTPRLSKSQTYRIVTRGAELFDRIAHAHPFPVLHPDNPDMVPVSLVPIPMNNAIRHLRCLNPDGNGLERVTQISLQVNTKDLSPWNPEFTEGPVNYSQSRYHLHIQLESKIFWPAGWDVTPWLNPQSLWAPQVLEWCSQAAQFAEAAAWNKRILVQILNGCRTYAQVLKVSPQLERMIPMNPLEMRLVKTTHAAWPSALPGQDDENFKRRIHQLEHALIKCMLLPTTEGAPSRTELSL